MKKLPIGIDDYKIVISENYYFVDKTLLIQELLSTSSAVTLICRPRRFGKTLNLSMLKYFFEKTEKSNANLFIDKKIWQYEDMRIKQGQHPVIFISFKDVKSKTFEAAYDRIALIISSEFERHAQILLPMLDEHQTEKYKSIISCKANSATLEESLLFLSKLLCEHYGKRVMIFIDEYDAPIHVAYKNDYYDDCIGFIKGLLSSALKSNSNLERGVLTGILRTAKESIFSDLNNLTVCTILSDEFSDKFGFIQEEVEAIMLEQQVPISIDSIKYWYNGYRAGEKTLIYNPWSILNCANKHGKLMTYWVNTSGNDLIKLLIAKANSTAKKELEALLTDTPIVKPIEEAFTFSTIYQADNALWSLLLFSGYITYTERVLTERGKYDCSLALPNHEIKELFKDFITEIFNNAFQDSEHLKEFFIALISGKTSLVQELLQMFIINNMSTFDLAISQPEISYHMFILGLLVTLEKTYSVRSNRESGYGRYDIMLIPYDKSQVGIIMEFKRAGEQSLEEAANIAIFQIQNKQYASELHALGVSHIIGYGIAFAGKNVFAKSIKL